MRHRRDFGLAGLSRLAGRCWPGVTVCSATLTLCALIPAVARAQTFTTLANLTGTSGSSPLFGALVQGIDGNLYGTASAGGAHAQGTVFKVTPSGTVTTLYSFCKQSKCTDGSAPFSGLVLGTDGNFYGTTESGGANGFGTVFKITPQGKLTTLHSFNSHDGANAYGGLMQGMDGNFYGTTESGGTNLLGTVFKITSQGTLTKLHDFDSTDGEFPEAAMLQVSSGTIYSTTYNGGTNGGYGTLFTMTTGGTLTTLHSFADETDGRNVTAGLAMDSAGNFYGATSLGGPNGFGTVYQFTPSNVLTILHSFNATDGASPNSLLLATDGNLYGTTISGAANGDGTIFEITPQGAFTTLHTFTGSDGADSFGGLVQATDGKLYGTTRVGGTKNDGVIFRLDVGLGPFVETVPAAGKVATKVKILGTSLTGATGVTFNGTAATFTVVSATEITTTVPAGATSGTVKVTTPGGPLSSNVAFNVRH